MNSLTTALPKRSDVKPQDKWAVESLFSSHDEWKEQVAKLSEKNPPYFPKLTAFKGRLHEGPEVLKAALDTYFSIARECDRLYTYAHLKHDEETTDDQYKHSYQTITHLFHRFSEESAWFDPELLSLDESQFKEFLHSPSLSDYRFYLEKTYRLKPHTLPADKEELLALGGQSLSTPSKAFSSLNNSDLKFGEVKDNKGNKHPLSHGSYGIFLRHPDRELRKNAFEQMQQTFLGVENTMADLLSGQMHAHLFKSRARKYTSPLEAALFPHNIPLSVYHSLIEAVRSKLSSLHRYMNLRKQKLGYDSLHHYDLYVPMVSDVDMHMDYEEAEQLVIESVHPLGSDYQKALRRGMKEEGWVDRYENINKRSGAYSSGCFDSSPFILMNYKGILRDVFTLAHEAGHSMHSYLSHKNQTYQDSHYPIFVAEVASTFNEELLMHLLLEKTQDPKKRLFLINEKLEDIRATLFRQTLFAEFELKIHELCQQGEPLTPNRLKEIYAQLNHDYYGDVVVQDPLISIEWARIPHFYYNFYVYQYATGISAALTLSERTLNGDTNARDAYLSFLKAGGSLFPIDLLKLAGIDMTKPDPIVQAIATFDDLLDQFESSL